MFFTFVFHHMITFLSQRHNTNNDKPNKHQAVLHLWENTRSRTQTVVECTYLFPPIQSGLIKQAGKLVAKCLLDANVRNRPTNDLFITFIWKKNHELKSKPIYKQSTLPKLTISSTALSKNMQWIPFLIWPNLKMVTHTTWPKKDKCKSGIHVYTTSKHTKQQSSLSKTWS